MIYWTILLGTFITSFYTLIFFVFSSLSNVIFRIFTCFVYFLWVINSIKKKDFGWVWSNELESWKCESKLAYLIGCDFGLNYVYKVLGDHINPVIMGWMYSWVRHLLKLDYLWTFDVLVAWKCWLSKFCLNGRFFEKSKAWLKWIVWIN